MSLRLEVNVIPAQVTGAGDETLRFWSCFRQRPPALHALSDLSLGGDVLR